MQRNGNPNHFEDINDVNEFNDITIINCPAICFLIW